MDFSRLVEIYEKMGTTTKRLALTDDLATLFSELSPDDIGPVIYLTQGLLRPEHEGVELGVGDRLLEESLSRVSGQDLKDIQSAFRNSGDLGLVAERLLKKKKQTHLSAGLLTVEKVYANFLKIAATSGEGSQEQKIRLLCELLSDASPQEGKAIARFVTGRLRLGVGSPTLIDALSVLVTKDKSLREPLERAFNLTNDLGQVAQTLLRDGMEPLRTIGPVPFNPIRPALAERLPDAASILEKLGPCLVEAKYDGLRLQIHLKGKMVEIYSRRQERVTDMFPDVISGVKAQFSAKEAIFEGEAIGYNESTGEFVPFQMTIQRKRKHGVGAFAAKIPLKLFCFDLLYADGKDWTSEPFGKRRAELERRIGDGDMLLASESKRVKTPQELEKLFDEYVGRGLEGLMAKDLSAPYVAGARKFAWIKLKRSYSQLLADTVDVVVLGFYYGKGKRTRFGFGGLLTGIYDEEGRRFRSIAKIGTGFSEKQMEDFRALLEPHIVKGKPSDVDSLLVPDAWVTPQYVVEVLADEITRSPVHTCAWRDKEGLALRFPRIVGYLRDDKRPYDATTEKEILELFELQGQRKSE